MKNLRFFLIALSFGLLFTSCNVWSSVFKPKYGCKTNGKNIGAEKLIDGNPEGTKAAKKAKKFKS